MQRSFIVGVLSVSIVALAGCQDLQGLWASQRQTKPGDAEIRWVSEPTEILDLRGPATAVAGVPVELEAQMVVGSSSCNKPGELMVSVDEGSRIVTLKATRLTAVAESPIPCTDDYGWVKKTVSVTLASAGTYAVKAERFKAGFGFPDGRTSQGELVLEVRAE